MKKPLLIALPIGVLLVLWWFFGRGNGSDQEIEYRYAPIEKGSVTRSISATGVLVALTTVDVKSKAGGKVVRLAVDEGAVVKKGDLIALIDPADTEAVYRQADADLRAAEARAVQAAQNFQLTVANNRSSIADAQAALDVAKSRLATMEIEHRRQPAISTSQLASAQANFDSAVQALEKYRTVTMPQTRRDVDGSLASSQAAFDAAKAALRRQRELLEMGFSSQAQVDQAEANYRSAESQFNLARQRANTLSEELQTTLKERQLAVEQARAQVTQARANQSDVRISDQDLKQARIAVQQAQIALDRARANLRNDAIRRSEVEAARASTTRSRVSVENAKVQLDSTTVVAPRGGVVTLKYLEEGTIIPPGTSTFAQGTSLVQISDVSQLYVECAVDEADIGAVREGQRVRIIAEAFPGRPFDGRVERISPAATTANSITAVKVRVRVLPGAKTQVLPGMNATCEFVTLDKHDVLVIPSQAVKYEEGKAYVEVKSTDPLKPARKEIKLGEEGNDGIEVVSGLKEGEEVVVATIDLKQLREIQEKMTEVQQGGGLAGGAGRGMGGARSATGSGGGGSAGGRGGGGGGGGR